jgi:hypothetical protein
LEAKLPDQEVVSPMKSVRKHSATNVRKIEVVRQPEIKETRIEEVT